MEEILDYVHVEPIESSTQDIKISSWVSTANSLTYIGWTCPNCKTVWSPYVESCRNCIPKIDKKYRDIKE